MDKKKIILLVAAMVVAVGTALLARSMFAGSGTPQAVAAPVAHDGPRVLVAQRALPTGTIITADAMKFQEWPEKLVQDAYFIDGESDINALLGTVVRYPITAGEPVTQGSLVSPDDRGFLAAALSPGMRAVSIPVSAQTGVAGFVFPGDRVDLVLTQTVTGEDGPALKTSETVMRNLRVLATDQQTTQEKDETGATVVRTSRIVTLEVTPKLAEKVAVAQTVGTLSLSLRPLADNQVELERAIASGEVVIPDGATPEEEERLLREAVSRPDAEGTTFQTGGDVSRFQRRTVPSHTPRRQAYNDDGPQAEAKPTGPTVKVARGNNVKDEPVGR